jgi:hypothetical protein
VIAFSVIEFLHEKDLGDIGSGLCQPINKNTGIEI